MDAKILIIDDERTIRKLLTIYLEEAGYACHAVENVAAAKEALASVEFDLLLCDLKLSGESGLDLIRYAKEHYPKTGKVMITAFGAPEIASEIIAIGVYGYIIKPISRNVVLVTVENALRHLQLDLHMQAYEVELENNILRRTEKIAAIMNNLNVGVIMLGLDFNCIEINQRMREWFPEFSMDKTTLCYHALKSPGCEGVCNDCPMVATFQTGKICEVTKSLITGQGEREFRIVMSPVLDNHGRIYAGIASYEDVTEKTFLENELRRAQKFEAVGQLAAGIAHEINTPIQYIGDNVTFLKDAFSDLAGVLNTYEHIYQELNEAGAVPAATSQLLSGKREAADLEYLWEEIPKTIDQSLEGIRRIEKIVRAMKEFSHPGSDEKLASDINKILENTTTVCRNEWKYVADMKMDLEQDLPLIPCHAGEISQAFLNIIVNGAHAIDEFTERGSKGKGKMSIQTIKAGNNIQIRISDTGGGIPDEIQGRIFESGYAVYSTGHNL